MELEIILALLMFASAIGAFKQRPCAGEALLAGRQDTDTDREEEEIDAGQFDPVAAIGAEARAQDVDAHMPVIAQRCGRAQHEHRGEGVDHQLIQPGEADAISVSQHDHRQLEQDQQQGAGNCPAEGHTADRINQAADAFRNAFDQVRQDEGDERQQEEGQQRNARPFQDCADMKEESRIHDGATRYLFASRAA